MADPYRRKHESRSGACIIHSCTGAEFLGSWVHAQHACMHQGHHHNAPCQQKLATSDTCSPVPSTQRPCGTMLQRRKDAGAVAHTYVPHSLLEPHGLRLRVHDQLQRVVRAPREFIVPHQHVLELHGTLLQLYKARKLPHFDYPGAVEHLQAALR